MFSRQGRLENRWVHRAAIALLGIVLVACGGGSQQDSGPNKTYLSVEAVDPDGDSLTYSATGMPSGASFAGQTFT